jgi:hypothetical protein
VDKPAGRRRWSDVVVHHVDDELRLLLWAVFVGAAVGIQRRHDSTQKPRVQALFTPLREEIDQQTDSPAQLFIFILCLVSVPCFDPASPVALNQTFYSQKKKNGFDPNSRPDRTHGCTNYRNIRKTFYNKEKRDQFSKQNCPFNAETIGI